MQNILVSNKYNNPSNSIDTGYVIDYSLGDNRNIESIIPISRFGKIELGQIDNYLIKESDKESIIELINYKLNGSGFIYLLSLRYATFDELNRVLTGIIIEFFQTLFKMNKNQLLNYSFIYKHITPYFEQIKNKLVV